MYSYVARLAVTSHVRKCSSVDQYACVYPLERSTTPSLESVTVKERISPSLEGLHQLTIQDGKFVGDKISAIVKHGKDFLILDNGTRFDISHLNNDQQSDRRDESSESGRYQNLMLPHTASVNTVQKPDQVGKHIIKFNIGPKEDGGEDITFMAKVHLTASGNADQDSEKKKRYNELFAGIRNNIIKEYNTMFGGKAPPEKSDNHSNDQQRPTFNVQPFFSKQVKAVKTSTSASGDGKSQLKTTTSRECIECEKKTSLPEEEARKSVSATTPYETAPFKENIFTKNRFRKIPNYFGNRLKDEYLRKSYHDYLLSLQNLEEQFRRKYEDHINHVSNVMRQDQNFQQQQQQQQFAKTQHEGNEENKNNTSGKITEKMENITSTIKNVSDSKIKDEMLTILNNSKSIPSNLVAIDHVDSGVKDKNMSTIHSNSTFKEINETSHEDNSGKDKNDTKLLEKPKMEINETKTANTSNVDGKNISKSITEVENSNNKKINAEGNSSLDLHKVFTELEGSNSSTTKNSSLAPNENKNDGVNTTTTNHLKKVTTANSSDSSIHNITQKAEANSFYKNMTKFEDQTLKTFYDLPNYEYKLDSEEEKIKAYNSDIYRGYLDRLQDLKVSLGVDKNISDANGVNSSPMTGFPDNSEWNHLVESKNLAKDESLNNSLVLTNELSENEAANPTQLHTKFGDFLLSERGMNVDPIRSALHLYTGPPQNYVPDDHTNTEPLQQQRDRQVNYLNNLKVKIDHLLHEVEDGRAMDSFENNDVQPHHSTTTTPLQPCTASSCIFNPLDQPIDKTPLLLKPEGILTGIRNVGDPANSNMNMLGEFTSGGPSEPGVGGEEGHFGNSDIQPQTNKYMKPEYEQPSEKSGDFQFHGDEGDGSMMLGLPEEN